MKVLNYEQMRQADRDSIAAGIPGLLLMENAAFAVLRALEQHYSPLSSHRIAIFCGKGNNGGDGLALARLLHLHHHPRQLVILLAYPPEDLSPDAAQQLQILETLGIPYSMQLPAHLPATTLAVDALLGTGVSGEPRSPLAEIIDLINQLPLAQRIAVDIPSANKINAHLTVTFAAPKLDHVLPPTCDQMGQLVIAPIGIPARFLNQATLNLTTLDDLKPVGQPRPKASHKGNFGHIAILGGAPGKPGALQLAGSAALRSGAGLVTLYSPDPHFATGLPDLMQAPWPQSRESLSQHKVLAIGPGLGTSNEAKQLVTDLYLHHPAPLVLDADALNLLAPLTTPHNTNLPRILTPHPGEMARLLGRPIADRLADANLLAQRTNSVVILKGQRTLIAFPDGQTWVNPTGSPALAKAGSGDVLTGILAALLAQYDLTPATLAAVYLHGRLGELAASHNHELTSLASRLCDYLPQALHELQ